MEERGDTSTREHRNEITLKKIDERARGGLNERSVKKKSKLKK